METNPVCGRKVFFLYPPSVVQDEMSLDLLRNGYEVYLLRDHLKIIPLLKEYPDSVLFVNIDKGLSSVEWEGFIVRLLGDSAFSDLKVGIVTYNIDPELAKRFTEIISLPYGYIRLKIGHAESLKILLDLLEAHGAKGRRQQVRVSCDGDLPMTFYFKIGSDTFTGRVFDISAVGMACVFDRKLDMPVGTHLSDIHVNLHQTILRISGMISIVRGEAQAAHIVMFDKFMPDVTREKILSYVHSNLQRSIERKLGSYPG